MATRRTTLSARAKRNLSSAGLKAVTTSRESADRAVASLGRWATTDHLGVGNALLNMPSMGFVDTCKYVLFVLFVSILGAVAGGIGIYVVVAHLIPFVLFG